MPKNKFFTYSLGPAYIEHIHDELVMLLWPGSDPVAPSEYRNYNLIASAAGRPFSSAFGRDAYPTLIDKSVALFHSLVSNHPFYNGNKRTAVIALDHFLAANSHVLLLSDSQMYVLAEMTATYKERGLSSDRAFAEIDETISPMIVPFKVLNKEAKKYPALKMLYEWSLRIRRMVRRNPVNLSAQAATHL